MSVRLGRQDLLGIGMTSQRRRDELLERLREQGVTHPEVLQVVRNMPRHLFIDEALANRAYEDCALPIGFGQTISQPLIVASMTEAILGGPDEPRPKKVLEIGTGSGYQAAVLAMLVDEVYTVERIESLYRRAQALLRRLALSNVRCLYSDGTLGWPEYGPYDAMVVTAAPDKVPQALLDQLRTGGRIIAPLGNAGGMQCMTVVRKTGQGVEYDRGDAVSFVPFLPGRD